MGQILQFKITLKDIKPRIWRQILVNDDITFLDLHYIIQIVMGWEDCHLHQFIINRNDRIGDPEILDDSDVFDEKVIRVKKVFTEVKEKLVYEYDFGDGWEHQIVLEKILESENAQKYPRCIKGANSCPPEDCGGPWVFMDMIEKLNGPDSKDKEELKKWLGGDFDPAAFDIQKINRML